MIGAGEIKASATTLRLIPIDKIPGVSDELQGQWAADQSNICGRDSGCQLGLLDRVPIFSLPAEGGCQASGLVFGDCNSEAYKKLDQLVQANKGTLLKSSVAERIDTPDAKKLLPKAPAAPVPGTGGAGEVIDCGEDPACFFAQSNAPAGTRFKFNGAKYEVVGSGNPAKKLDDPASSSYLKHAGTFTLGIGFNPTGLEGDEFLDYRGEDYTHLREAYRFGGGYEFKGGNATFAYIASASLAIGVIRTEEYDLELSTERVPANITSFGLKISPAGIGINTGPGMLKAKSTVEVNYTMLTHGDNGDIVSKGGGNPTRENTNLTGDDFNYTDVRLGGELGYEIYLGEHVALNLALGASQTVSSKLRQGQDLRDGYKDYVGLGSQLYFDATVLIGVSK